jgi:hypothetical protein
MEQWKDELQKLMLSCHVPDGLLCERRSGLGKAKQPVSERTVGALHNMAECGNRRISQSHHALYCEERLTPCPAW